MSDLTRIWSVKRRKSIRRAGSAEELVKIASSPHYQIGDSRYLPMSPFTYFQIIPHSRLFTSPYCNSVRHTDQRFRNLERRYLGPCNKARCRRHIIKRQNVSCATTSTNITPSSAAPHIIGWCKCAPVHILRHFYYAWERVNIALCKMLQAA